MVTSALRDENPLLPFLWIGLTIILLAADFLAGPFIQFPITYLIPVALASWYNGRRWGLGYAILLPCIRLFFNVALWTVPWTLLEASINCLIRITVFSLFAVLIDKTARQSRQLAKEVNMLSGLLPICAFCKKIRDDKNQWQPIELYISQKTEASFSHGFCSDCVEKTLWSLSQKTMSR
ncbi:MAG: hypothetical protein KDC45_06540 [Bacteroidetes bacterium]|nr:hypothetical protein [Bacteroidota bacterium]